MNTLKQRAKEWIAHIDDAGGPAGCVEEKAYALLQELIDAPEVLEATNPSQISSSAEPPADVARDAERYRWLRQQCNLHEGSLTIARVGMFGLLPWCWDNPDAAIDAARGRQGGE